MDEARATKYEDSKDGRITNEIRDTKMAVDDAFHVLGELNAKLQPIMGLGPSEKTQPEPSEAESVMKEVSPYSETYDALRHINTRVYELQAALRLMIERVEI